MTISRLVTAETLDTLSEMDPYAQRARRDLRRVHRVMGTRSILCRAFKELVASDQLVRPLKILELGAGDGTLMLGVAQVLKSPWLNVELTLLDRQSLVETETIHKFADIGWKAIPYVIDVLEWVSTDDLIPNDAKARWDLIVVNLFLHHFEGIELASLLQAISMRTNLLVACEPKRGWIPLLGSHLIGAIGANKVTREDAVLSVHAGFRGGELTALWPSELVEWRIKEYSRNLFSHCFTAERLKMLNAN